MPWPCVPRPAPVIGRPPTGRGDRGDRNDKPSDRGTAHAPKGTTNSTTRISHARRRANFHDRQGRVPQPLGPPLLEFSPIGIDKKVGAYWHIGQRIEEESVSEDVGYYGAIIKDLSRDLHVSTRTLYDAVQFFRAHEEAPESEALNWSHHRILLRLRTKEHRQFYERLIEKERLSARALEAAIAEGLHLGKKKPGKPTLPRPTDPEYLYRATVLSVIDGDTLDLDIDLGFGVFRRLRARLANIDTPDIASPQGRKARDFVAAELMAAQTVCIKTIKVDLHGRYVVHLFHLERKASLSKCFAEGNYLNEELLGAKLARKVS